MDGLTDEERALAWAASWNPSFAGTAIIDEDFSFRSVNPQFCKILGVTPGELIGQNFKDLTPPEVKAIDEKNSMLVKQGIITSYILRKTYEFEAHREEINIILLVVGVYDLDGEFLFFVSRIMLDDHHVKLTRPSPKPTGFTFQNIKRYLQDYWKALVALGVITASAILHYEGVLNL